MRLLPWLIVFLTVQFCLAKFSRFYVRSLKTHKEAMDYCAAKGHNLMIIRSDEKMREMIAEAFTLKAKKFWTGIRRDRYPNKKPWQWKYASVDNGPIEKEYFSDGQPDNFLDMEHCIEMFIPDVDMGNLKRWNDVKCSDKRSFFCESV